jgi:glycosyltransferase involved in cell wall biosynthesis
MPGANPTIELSQTGNLVKAEAQPVLASLASMTCAAVVHGPHYHELVAANCPGPVITIPLCYPDTGLSKVIQPLSATRRVTVFGLIHEQKQPLRVMEALARLRGKVGKVEFHVVGDISDFYRTELVHEAGRLGIQEPVFHGYVTDEHLQALLEQSHAICCLRYPVTEGSSASLITALYRGRPVIVPDVASFGMIPDDLVFKVSYSHDPGDLAQVLETVFSDQSSANARAMRARAWAADRFSAARYINEFEQLIEEAQTSAELARVARAVAPAVMDDQGFPIMAAVEAFAAEISWMAECQR